MLYSIHADYRSIYYGCSNINWISANVVIFSSTGEFEDVIKKTLQHQKFPFNFECDFVKNFFDDDKTREVPYEEFTQLLEVLCVCLQRQLSYPFYSTYMDNNLLLLLLLLLCCYCFAVFVSGDGDGDVVAAVVVVVVVVVVVTALVVVVVTALVVVVVVVVVY